jgi:hypothetical protein
VAAGGGVVEGKEFEKKSVVLQQCREKIESVCFDLRLRKVSAARGGRWSIYKSPADNRCNACRCRQCMPLPLTRCAGGVSTH